MSAAEGLDATPQDSIPGRADAVVVLDAEDAGLTAVVLGRCAGWSLGLDLGQGPGDLRRDKPRDTIVVSVVGAPDRVIGPAPLAMPKRKATTMTATTMKRPGGVGDGDGRVPAAYAWDLQCNLVYLITKKVSD